MCCGTVWCWRQGRRHVARAAQRTCQWLRREAGQLALGWQRRLDRHGEKPSEEKGNADRLAYQDERGEHGRAHFHVAAWRDTLRREESSSEANLLANSRHVPLTDGLNLNLHYSDKRAGSQHFRKTLASSYLKHTPIQYFVLNLRDKNPTLPLIMDFRVSARNYGSTAGSDDIRGVPLYLQPKKYLPEGGWLSTHLTLNINTFFANNRKYFFFKIYI